eukprot:TRINITY_DN1359_c0_g1_i4.p1 TRINITY_DN1359_c0_g1~~TRINITY_DN1359_c0_g1_i4.p1  ORF type:complete len:779 (-),score=216.30 TRINITY_DN1359_c0_g1_i4:1168-3504(-)
MSRPKYAQVIDDEQAEHHSAGHSAGPSPFSYQAKELEMVVEERDMNFVKNNGVQRIAEGLKTDLNSGIGDQIPDSERILAFGRNVFPETLPASFWVLWWEALHDETLIILMVAAIISIVLGVSIGDDRGTDWIEGFAILVAVFLVSGVTAGNDWHKDQKFRKLNKIREMKMIKVIRHGTRKTTPNDSLLVGDVILLETGDAIPADILFVHGHDLKVDMSSMTGESELVLVDEHNPFLLAGCRVMEGSCSGIVIAVGIHSQWGKIKLELDEEVEDTPLQNKLTNLADFIGKVGMFGAILLFVVCVMIYTIGHYAIDKEEWDSSAVTDILDYLIVSISLICVAVPEGLPLAVTISLAYSMFEMMKDNNLVRHLAACETMGGATNICSDKTGTLTENKMKVLTLWMGGKDCAAKDNLPISGQLLHSLATGISINSTAYLTQEDGKELVIGSTTEGAMIKYLRDIGVDYQEVRNKVPVKKVYPFSSLSKRMATAIATGSSTVFLVKGAAEVLVESCESYQDENGEAKPLDRSIAENKIKELASQGLRTLCIAYAVFPQDIELPAEIPETQLTLTAILGIKDPVRASVPNAVLACRGAGITVRMVTGDNSYTARHIAKECHILTEDGTVLEGPVFRKMTDEQIDEILPRLQVLARSSPNDKLRLVNRLKAAREVVASTGDGTNDAPQLKAADVGFSMGITGTEVAKEASDIILLDDNFTSIVKAVMWGRNVYDSIRKFLQLQLTVNLAAMVVAFVGAVSNGESPLKSVQLLWVNLIMDTFAGN